MAWWSRTDGLPSEPKKSVPRGVWTKCEGCAATLYELELDDNARVCKHCDHHHRMPTDARITLVVDEGSWAETDVHLQSDDPLGFRVDEIRYRDQLRSATKKTGASDAYRAGPATIHGHEVEIGFFDFAFMGGSMGSVVGEKIARQFERALERRRPALVFCASGGARMQEGVLSLMQMAKTSAARARLLDAGVPYISVLLHPTTGGVAASIAMLGDLILAEPNALIGFAGPRVIEQTIRQQLPEGFQRSEFLVEHGMVDVIVRRLELKATLARVLRWFGSTPVASEQAADGGHERDER
ncbi:acetyl-CoA carboxylase, carboxyltransferase subunit beta [Haliangium ochraceum]|uniref:Acetyl-coenzyme A carboxylase carboxyl transferase subunit beta n=1 Tax=Haliangium ochraceum (strain DSM 14365 / JCM 11303 / SMP-2) TaxID=502025 RepID=D0LYA6_HALO1|nr:acetyl-CoA carboxylase, carboxyltransferase subunit beta [Haliangium ochraceum]ACY16256.1 acetyl-CoA carboxylase, carboxyl transferase, beta subunit [Haliangium ochraceum DSM 14365]